MKILKIFYFLFLLSIFACQHIKEKKQFQISDYDSNIKSIDDTTNKSSNIPDKLSVSQKQIVYLIGIWKAQGDENPTFEITKDSIFYIDQGEAYKYEIIKDTMVIYYKTWTYKGCFKVEKNKLYFKDRGKMDVYDREPN